MPDNNPLFQYGLQPLDSLSNNPLFQYGLGAVLPESDWEDLGIFERNKSTGEVRLKDKPNQLGGIGGEAVALLPTDISIPDTAELKDQDLESLFKDQDQGWFKTVLDTARSGAVGGLSLAADLPASLLDAQKSFLEFSTGALFGEEAGEKAGESYEAPLNWFREIGDDLDTARQQFMRPGAETPTATSELVHDVKKLFNEEDFSLLEVAGDLPLAVVEQAAEMGMTAGLGKIGKVATGITSAAAKAPAFVKGLTSAIGLGYAARTGSETYDEMARNDVNRLLAGGLATVNATASAALEYAGWIKSFGGENFAKDVIVKNNSKLLARVALNAVGGAGAEGITEASQGVVDYIVRTTPDVLTTPEMLYSKEYWSGLGGEALGSAIGGFGVGLGFGAAGGISRPEELRIKETIEAEKKSAAAAGVEASAGLIGDAIAIASGRNAELTDDNVFASIYEEIQEAKLAKSPVERNKRAKALSEQIEQVLASIKEAEGLASKKDLDGLYVALDSLAEFSAKRAQWAEDIRSNIHTLVNGDTSTPHEFREAQDGDQKLSEKDELVTNQFIQAVERVGGEAYSAVMQIANELQSLTQALSSQVQPPPMQEGMTPEQHQAQLEEFAAVQEVARQMALSTLPEIQEKFRSGDWKWVGLTEEQIAELPSLNWELMARTVAKRAKNPAQKTASLVLSEVGEITGGTLSASTAKNLSSKAQLTNEQLFAAFPDPDLGTTPAQMAAAQITELVGGLPNMQFELAAGKGTVTVLGQLALASEAFGLYAIVNPKVRSAAMSQPNDIGSIHTEIIDGLKAKGFDTTKLDGTEITEIAKAVIEVANSPMSQRVQALSDLYEATANLSLTLAVTQPEVAEIQTRRQAGEVVAEIERGIASGFDMMWGADALLGKQSPPSYQREATALPTNNIVIGKIAMRQLLSGGPEGLKFLLDLTGVLYDQNPSADSDLRLFKLVTGRDAPNRAIAGAFADRVQVALDSVPGPHTILKSLDPSGLTETEQVGVLAAVDAMASAWVDQDPSSRSKQQFYDNLADRWISTGPISGLRFGGFAQEGGETLLKNDTLFNTLAAFGKRAIAILTKPWDKRAGITVLHEIVHALQYSGMLDEMLPRQQAADLANFIGVPSLRGRWAPDEHEKLTVGFESFMATRAAPNKQLTPVFNQMKRYVSNMLKSVFTIDTFKRLAAANIKISGQRLLTRSGDIDVGTARAFYAMLNAHGLTNDQLDLLGPGNYEIATVNEISNTATGINPSQEFLDQAKDVEETIEQLNRSLPQPQLSLSDDSNDQTGEIKGEDLKEHVEQYKKDLKNNPAIDFPSVSDKKTDAKKKPKQKRRSVRIKKPGAKEGARLLAKLEAAAKNPDVDRAIDESLEDFARTIFSGPREIDSAEKLTLRNWRRVLPEKATNWVRMATTGWFSKTAAAERYTDLHALGSVGMHIANLAGVAMRAARVTDEQPQVFDGQENIPIPGSKSLRQIFETMVPKIRTIAESKGMEPEAVFQQFKAFLAASREIEIYDNQVKRVSDFNAAIKKWEEEGSDPNTRPADPPYVRLDEAWVKVSKQLLTLLRVKYGNDGMLVFSEFQDQLVKDFAHHAILGKLLYNGLISKEDYKRMVEKGSKWVPFQRLVEFVDRIDVGDVVAPDGSVYDPVKYLKMDISGGIKDPLSELIKRATAVEMIVQRQYAKNKLSDHIVDSPEFWKNDSGMHVVSKKVRVSKKEWEEAGSAALEPEVKEHPEGGTRTTYKVWKPVEKEELASWMARARSLGDDSWIFANWREGKPTYIRVTDKALAAALQNYNNPQAATVQKTINKFTGTIGWLTRELVGQPITSSVSFVYNMFIRDLPAAFARSLHGALPLESAAHGLGQAFGVMFPSLAEARPERFAVAQDYLSGMAGMATLQSQFHDVQAVELTGLFKRRAEDRATGLMSGLIRDIRERAVEKGVYGSPIISPSEWLNARMAKKRSVLRALIRTKNTLAFVPGIVAEAFELSWRLGERNLAMGETLGELSNHPFVAGHYANTPKVQGEWRLGFESVKHRLEWKKHKRRLASDPTYVPPESAMPIYYNLTERDYATRQVTLDFGSKGANENLINASLASKLYVFWNPKMQDFYSTMKRIRPLFDSEAPPKLKKQAQSFVIKTVAITMLPALAQFYAYKDDDDWWKESFLERVAYLHIGKTKDGRWIRVPAGISFATLLFRDLPMSGLSELYNKDPDAMSQWLNRFFDQAPAGFAGRAAMKWIEDGADFAGKQLLYDMVPSILQGPVGFSINYDGFFGEEIVRPQMYAQERRTDVDADRFGYLQNKIARAAGVEPARADYLVRRLFPGINFYPAGLANKIAGQVGLSGEEMMSPSAGMAFGTRMDPWLSPESWGPRSEWVQDFSKMFKTAQADRATYENYMENRKEVRAMQIMRDNPLISDNVFPMMQEAKEMISEYYKLRRSILESDLTEEEKKVLVLSEVDMPMTLLAIDQVRSAAYYLENSK